MSKSIVLVILLMALTANISFAGTTMTNLEIIKSTYEGKNAKENGENLKHFVDDNISWTEAEGFPYAGTYIGFEQIERHVFHRLASEWINYRFNVEGYVSNGDKVVAYGTYSGTNKITNTYFEARVAHLWKLDNSKIISFEQFVDSKKVVDALPESIK